MDFWNLLKKKLSSTQTKEREAQLMLEAKMDPLFEFMKKANTDEELHNSFLLIEDDLKSLSREIGKETSIPEEDIFSYGKNILLGKKDFIKTAESFTTTTEFGNFKVSLEKSYEMGAKEYPGKECVYLITVSNDEGFFAAIPFVSETGEVPEEASLIFDSMRKRGLSNWPEELQQKVKDNVFNRVQYFERAKGKHVPEVEKSEEFHSKAMDNRIQKEALNAADVVAYTTDSGEILCENCAYELADKLEEEGKEVYNEYGELDYYFNPVFVDEEFDSYPACDHCGELITDVSLTSDGVEYEKEHHPELVEGIYFDKEESSGKIRKELSYSKARDNRIQKEAQKTNVCYFCNSFDREKKRCIFPGIEGPKEYGGFVQACKNYESRKSRSKTPKRGSINKESVLPEGSLTPEVVALVKEHEANKELMARAKKAQERNQEIMGILEPIFEAIDDRMAQIDGIVYEFVKTESKSSSYKEAFTEALKKVNAATRKVLEDVLESTTKPKIIRKFKLHQPAETKAFTETKTAGVKDVVVNLWKKLLRTLDRSLSELKSIVKSANLNKPVKKSGINPHCPNCGSLQLNKNSNNSYSCKECGHKFKWYKDGTYEHTPDLETKDTQMSAGFGPAEKRASKKGETYSSKEAMQKDSLSRLEKFEFEEKFRNFYDDTMKILTDYFTQIIHEAKEEGITPPKLYSYYKAIHSDIRYAMEGALNKTAQNVFQPTNFAEEPESLVPEFEGKEREEKSVTKSYVTEEEIRRWFGGHVPKKDSVVIDANGNKWRYNGPVGPDTHEIELLKEEGPTPDTEMGTETGLLPPEEPFEPTEEEQLEMEEEAGFVAMRKSGQRIICENCDNYNPLNSLCEFWGFETSPDDKCDNFEPVAIEREFVENYTPAPKMEADIAAEGNREKMEKSSQGRYRRYYKGDPRWINVKYRAYCYDCQKELRPGEEALYWPNGKQIYCKDCGEAHYTKFRQEADDEDFFSSNSRMAQLDKPALKIIELYKQDPSLVRKEVMDMDQDKFAHLIDEVNEIKGVEELKKFLHGLWNEKYANYDWDVEGQEPFYSTDAPLAYNTPKPKHDQELLSDRVKIEKFANIDVSDEELVEKILSHYEEIGEVHEIIRDGDFVEIFYL